MYVTYKLHDVFNCILSLFSHSLIRVYPSNDKQALRLAGFNDPDNQIEILKVTRGSNDSSDLLVPPAKIEFVNNFIETNQLRSQVKTSNYGRYVVLFFF